MARSILTRLCWAWQWKLMQQKTWLVHLDDLRDYLPAANHWESVGAVARSLESWQPFQGIPDCKVGRWAIMRLVIVIPYGNYRSGAPAPTVGTALSRLWASGQRDTDWRKKHQLTETTSSREVGSPEGSLAMAGASAWWLRCQFPRYSGCECESEMCRLDEGDQAWKKNHRTHSWLAATFTLLVLWVKISGMRHALELQISFWDIGMFEYHFVESGEFMVVVLLC